MLKNLSKNKNNLFYIVVFLLYFICAINVSCYAASSVIGPGANIKSNTKATTEPETTHPKGFKVENAQYYDYVGYDDQGRLVDKSNIIIGKGEGGSGSGGGSAGSGNNGADSSGTGGSGTSGYIAGQAPGQGGSGTNVGGSGSSNSKNTIGSNGSNSSSDALKKQQLTAEAARQASVEAKLNEMAARKSIQDELLKRAIEEARRQSEAAPKIQQTVDDPNVVKNKPVQETESMTYNIDQTTRSPVNHTEKVQSEKQSLERVTQPKPNLDKTQPTVVLPETVKETAKNAPDKNLPEATTKVANVTNGPEDFIEETTIIESEVVTKEEVTTKATVKATTAKKVEEAKKQEATQGDKKKGEQGEKDHDDEDAEYKKELGLNSEDGKGDGKGGIKTGVKIFELDRKGNLGIKETPGINTLEKMIAIIVISLLLLIGIVYYYVPYIHKSKNVRSNYIS